MESEFQQQHFLIHHQQHDHQHQRPRNSGLIRYQSAPSSYFSSFGESIEEFLDRPTSPETERILSGFLQTTDTSNNVDSFLHHAFNSDGTEKKPPPEVKTEKEEEEETEIPVTAMEVEIPVGSDSIGYASVSRNLSQNKKRPRDDRTPPPASNLARHNSSPAGLFSSIDVETAYAAVMKSMGGFGGGNVMNTSNTTDASSLTPRSKLLPPVSRAMSPISEVDVKPAFSSRLPPRTLSGGFNRSFGNEGSASSKLSAIARTQSGGLDQYKTKDEDSASRRPPLAHHMSLPKSLSDIEQLLSDSIPCKIRAKRGCATHPRSIAERVRRTKISERMRKLQDLVPNMDTQTNTADMLDLAVQYIKDLQDQVKALEENRARCRCSSA
ncbi:PREDICTED: transcription factor bHLH122-like [Camelina sativa]|uniref:Transcription factor bHLH122-like n=1 Tax=Camelina sativa TaxID=90675 RepID=A0ABM0YGV5_CAMSA|nr:PREDICTED: transcription factor bHLH122-like [Camelina sativa]